MITKIFENKETFLEEYKEELCDKVYVFNNDEEWQISVECDKSILIIRGNKLRCFNEIINEMKKVNPFIKIKEGVKIV